MLNPVFKRLICLLVLLLVVGLAGQVIIKADTGVTVSISSADKVRKAGETFTVDLLINSGTTKIRGWQGGIYFDSDLLECKGITAGTFLEKFGTVINVGQNTGAMKIYNDSGEIDNIAFAVMSQNTGGASGSGKLCTLSFKVKDDASGSANIEPIDIILADEGANQVEIETLDAGTVEIQTLHPEVTLDISASEEQLLGGDEFDVIVSIDTADLATLGAGLKLKFDESRLSCKRVSESGFFSSQYDTRVDPAPVIDNSSGNVAYFQINVAGSETTGPSGNGDLCTFRMKAKSKTGTARITMESAKVIDENGNEIAGVTVDPASIAVLIVSSEDSTADNPATSFTPIPSFSPTPTPTLTPSPDNSSLPTTGATKPAIPTPSQITAVPPKTTPTGTTTKPAAGKTPQDQAQSNTPAPTQTLANKQPAKTSVPSSTPAAINQEAVVFDLSGLTDDKGAVTQDFSDRGALSADGNFSLSLQIDSGTSALSRQRKPLESITFIQKAISANLPRQKDLVIVFEGTPSGSVFSSPVTLTVIYEPDALPSNVSENDLKLAVYDSQKGEWQVLTSQVNGEEHTVSAEVSHFSTFALLADPGGLSWIIFAAGGLVMAVVVAALLFWFLKRKKTTSTLARQRPPSTELGSYLNNNLTDIYKDKSGPDDRKDKG